MIKNPENIKVQYDIISTFVFFKASKYIPDLPQFHFIFQDYLEVMRIALYDARAIRLVLMLLYKTIMRDALKTHN